MTLPSCWILTPSWVTILRVDMKMGHNSSLQYDPGHWIMTRVISWYSTWNHDPGHNSTWNHAKCVNFWYSTWNLDPDCNSTWNRDLDHNSTLNYDPGSQFKVKLWPGVTIQYGIMPPCRYERRTSKLIVKTKFSKIKMYRWHHHSTEESTFYPSDGS